MPNVEQYRENKIVQLFMNLSSCAMKDGGDQEYSWPITGWAQLLYFLTLDGFILMLNMLSGWGGHKSIKIFSSGMNCLQGKANIKIE